MSQETRGLGTSENPVPPSLFDYLGVAQRIEHVPRAEIPNGTQVVYLKDGNLYRRAFDGDPVRLDASGGGGIENPLTGTLDADGNDITGAGKVEADELNGGVTGSQSLTDLFGQGLEFASGALQVLSSIWNGSNIVADVNNSQVTTNELFTAPQAVMLTKDSTQSIASGTITELTWESADERNSAAPAFGDLANDGITVPNGDYSFGKFTIAAGFDTAVSFDFLQIQKNGAIFEGKGIWRPAGTSWRTGGPYSSAWVPVSSGDTFTAEIGQSSGNPQTVEQEEERVFFEGWFL